MLKNSKFTESQIITRPTERALIPLVSQINGLVRRFGSKKSTETFVTSSPSPTSSSTSNSRVPESIRASSIRLTKRIDAFCHVATGLHAPPRLRPPLRDAISNARSAAVRLERIMESLSRAQSENSDDYRMTFPEKSAPLVDIEGVGDKLLNSLTLILATSDQILVECVKDALILVQGSLDELYARQSFPAFIITFEAFGNHMITLGHVTSPTRLDLKDLRKRCYLEMSRNVLETSTQLVLNSFKMNLRSPTCPQTLALKKMVYDYVKRALTLIYKIVDLNVDEFASCREVDTVCQLVEEFEDVVETGLESGQRLKNIAKSLASCVQVFTDCHRVDEESRMTLKLTLDSFKNNLNYALLDLNENGGQTMLPDDISVVKCFNDLHDLKRTMNLVCHEMAAKLSRDQPAFNHVIATLYDHVIRRETTRQLSDRVSMQINQLSNHLEERVELLRLMSIVGGSRTKGEEIFDSSVGIRSSKISGQNANTQNNKMDGYLRREAELHNAINISTFCQRAIPLILNICLNASVSTAFQYTAAGGVGKSPSHVEVCTQTLDLLLQLHLARRGSADNQLKVSDKIYDGRCLSLPRRGKHGSSFRPSHKTTNGDCYNYLQQGEEEDGHKRVFNENYV